MIKKILTYSFGEVLVKGISFLAVPLYSRLISPSEYGTLGFLNALFVFFPLVFTMYYMYAYVRFSVDVEDERLISTYFYLGLFLNIFYFICGMILYFLVIQNYDIQLKYFTLAIVGSISLYMFQIVQMYNRSKGLANKYLKFSITYSLIALVLNLTFLLLLEDNVNAMLGSSALVSILASLLAYKFLKEYVFWEKFDTLLVYDILKYSIPLVPGAIALLLFSSSDKIILAQYISKEELGIYTLATTLGLAMGYLGRAFFMGYQPLFYEKIASQRYNDIKEQFWKNILMLLVALIATLGIIFIAYKVIDSKYITGLPIAMSIALTYSFVTFSQMMELHLTHMKKTSYVSYIYGIGGVMTVVGLLIFTPNFGTFGAIMALFISAFITSITMYVTAQKVLYISYNKLFVALFYLSVLCLWYILLVD